MPPGARVYARYSRMPRPCGAAAAVCAPRVASAGHHAGSRLHSMGGSQTQPLSEAGAVWGHDTLAGYGRTAYKAHKYKEVWGGKHEAR